MTTQAVRTLLLVLFLLGLAGFGLYLLRPHARGEQSYQTVRSDFVALQAAIAGPQETVVLGDSIIESTWLDGACGKTFNAGVGGARVEDVQLLARKILPSLRPSTVVVSVGTNHFWQGEHELPTFRSQYNALVDDLSGWRLILIGVPNSAAADQYVRRIAEEKGALYLPPTRGSAPDGIHLTAADAAALRQRIEQACGDAS